MALPQDPNKSPHPSNPPSDNPPMEFPRPPNEPGRQTPHAKPDPAKPTTRPEETKQAPGCSETPGCTGVNPDAPVEI